MEPKVTHELWKKGVHLHNWDERAGRVQVNRQDWTRGEFGYGWLVAEGYKVSPIVVDLENK